MSKTVYDQYENGMMYIQIQISGKLMNTILSIVKRINMMRWFVDEHVNVQSVQLQTSAFGANHLSPSRTWAHRLERGAKCETTASTAEPFDAILLRRFHMAQNVGQLQNISKTYCEPLRVGC